MGSMSTLAPPDADLLAWYDALGEDPPGFRLEIVEGVLIVSPSPEGEHQDRARGLADLLDVVVDQTGLRAREDVDWHLVHPVRGLGSRLRPDVSVLDPDDPHGPRPVTVEVLSPSDHQRLVPGEEETRIEGKRRAYAYGGAAVHVEVEPFGAALEVRWYEVVAGRFELAGAARGSEALEVGGPHPFTVVPDEVGDWLRRRLRELGEAVDGASARAEQERARAERAEQELRGLRGANG